MVDSTILEVILVELEDSTIFESVTVLRFISAFRKFSPTKDEIAATLKKIKDKTMNFETMV